MSTVESNRAGRIRLRLKAKQRVTAEDLAFLETYEKTHGKSNGATGRSAAKSRKVSYVEEETQAASEGTGSAAEIAAAALATRAEGERLDSILKIGVQALVEAVSCYKKMTMALLAERQADAETHRALLESVRVHYIERTQAEAELIRQQAENDAAQLGEGGLEAAATQALGQALVQKLTGTDGPKVTPVNSGRVKKG